MQGSSEGEAMDVDETKLRRAIARRMRVAMARCLMNQNTLAKGCGLTQQGISLILNEKRTPDLVSLEAIAKTLRVSEAWLMGKEKKA